MVNGQWKKNGNEVKASKRETRNEQTRNQKHLLILCFNV